MRSLRSRWAELAASRHVRGVGSTTVALVAAQLMMALAGVLAARELGPASRGVVTAVVTWPTILAYLSLIGLIRPPRYASRTGSVTLWPRPSEAQPSIQSWSEGW